MVLPMVDMVLKLPNNVIIADFMLKVWKCVPTCITQYAVYVLSGDRSKKILQILKHLLHLKII